MISLNSLKKKKLLYSEVTVFDSCVTALARLPALNSYARTPSLVWKLGWTPTPSGELRTHLPPLPVDYLKDKDVLKEFVSRINMLGKDKN